MPTDPGVDEYIARASEFAKPILKKLRQAIHEGCPEAQEDMKWSRPAFLYRNKILFGMAAFKAHCTFYAFERELGQILKGGSESAHDPSGLLGRITSFSDLPSKSVLLDHVKQAARWVDEVAATPVRKKARPARKAEAEIPPDFAKALSVDKAAEQVFRKFSPSHRREYLEWIGEAKREETRQKRIATALEWLAEGKSRNWKYVNC